MKILDLFSGLHGWAKPFEDRGHGVDTLDLDPKFGCTFTGDALDTPVNIGRNYDVILASPPCEAFSVAAIGHHWTGGLRAYEPATDHARTSLALVHWTVAVIEASRPMFWVVENPRGMLRKLGVLDRYERTTVTYCQYGDDRMKPTDLWGGFPRHWYARPVCRNGAPCHEAAPRGAKTGTQGRKGAAERAVVPYQLGLELAIAMEDAVRAV